MRLRLVASRRSLAPSLVDQLADGFEVPELVECVGEAGAAIEKAQSHDVGIEKIGAGEPPSRKVGVFYTLAAGQLRLRTPFLDAQKPLGLPQGVAAVALDEGRKAVSIVVVDRCLRSRRRGRR